MLRRYILFLKKRPLLTAAFGIVYALVCIHFLPSDTSFQMLLVRTLLCGAMIFFLYQISGEKTLLAYYNSTGYVIKVALGFWIFAFLGGSLGMIGHLIADTPYWDNMALHALTVFLMFVFVGLFEEMAFRALINDAIIYRFRDKKYVFVLSAVCCSLVFGAAHVIGADLSTPLAWAQAAGKTISTGVFGLVLLILYWKTRNIWACGIVHGVYDFLLSMSMCVFQVDQEGISYVMSDDKALPVIIAYGFMTVLELVILLFVWLKVGRKIDYQQIRENW